jgi:hypothetical protein
MEKKGHLKSQFLYPPPILRKLMPPHPPPEHKLMDLSKLQTSEEARRACNTCFIPLSPLLSRDRRLKDAAHFFFPNTSRSSLKRLKHCTLDLPGTCSATRSHL